jgi:rhodanese-related sulfurtransferase
VVFAEGLAALPIPASAMDHNARTRGLAGRSTSSAAGASRCSDGGGIEGKPLHGARRVDPGTSAEMGLPGAARDVPVVTYCVVGYRSAEFTTRLRAARFTYVQNLEGSIFRWANQHRPLVSDGVPASRVHPYSKSWGQLLADDVRAGL